MYIKCQVTSFFQERENKYSMPSNPCHIKTGAILLGGQCCLTIFGGEEGGWVGLAGKGDGGSVLLGSVNLLGSVLLGSVLLGSVLLGSGLLGPRGMTLSGSLEGWVLLGKVLLVGKWGIVLLFGGGRIPLGGDLKVLPCPCLGLLTLLLLLFLRENEDILKFITITPYPN